MKDSVETLRNRWQDYQDTVRNIQNAHESQIENILQHINAGNVAGAIYICENLLAIYKNRREKQNG